MYDLNTVRELARQVQKMDLLWWWFENVSDDRESAVCRTVREVICERKGGTHGE